MATIIQCTMCAKPFQSYGGKICHNCLEQLDKDFITIRDYLSEHKGPAGVEKISRETKVPKASVLHLLREKRLQIDAPSSDSLSCEVCRAPITTGRICEQCRDSLSRKLVLNAGAAPAERSAGSGQRGSGQRGSGQSGSGQGGSGQGKFDWQYNSKTRDKQRRNPL